MLLIVHTRNAQQHWLKMYYCSISFEIYGFVLGTSYSRHQRTRKTAGSHRTPFHGGEPTAKDWTATAGSRELVTPPGATGMVDQMQFDSTAAAPVYTYWSTGPFPGFFRVEGAAKAGGGWHRARAFTDCTIHRCGPLGLTVRATVSTTTVYCKYS